jgi:hypothetical protein
VTRLQEKLFGKQTPTNKANQGNVETKVVENDKTNTTNVEDITKQQTNEVQDIIETEEQS